MPDTAPPISAQSTRYRWRLIRAGTFKLDAGSMFGLIPRVVWSRSVPADDKGRITVAHNCLLLEGGGKRILIEAGTGDKLDDKSREIFDMDRTSIHEALAHEGVAAESIDAVIVSHLHFDHAGGLTRLCKPGETPDWTGPAGGMAGKRPDHSVKRTFPNAVIFAQSREWEDALANRSVMTRTYFSDHLEPLRPQIRLIDSPRPFPTGVVPGKDELPQLPVSYRTSTVPGFGGVGVFLVPGHTWGQQAVVFTDESGQVVVFTPDVMPTLAHNGAAYNLAYDVEPYTSMVSRRWLLDEAARQGWVLALDHEPGNPFVKVKANDKGWYDLTPVAAP